MNKKEIIALFIRQLEANVQVILDSARGAKDEATHAEAKAENKYDTRGLEAAYLAGAQARRAVELNAGIEQIKALPLAPINELSKVVLTALVELTINSEQTKWLLLLPTAGGLSVDCDGVVVHSITPESPIGQRIINRRLGYDFEMVISGKVSQYEITQLI